MTKLVFYDRVKCAVSGTPGASTVTVGTAVSGYRTPASAGASDTETVPIVFEDGSAWEESTCVLSSTATVLTRTLVRSSTGSLLSLTSSATFFIGAHKEHLVPAIGTIQAFLTTPDDNWLPCNGSIYTKSSYTALATALGSLAGAWTPVLYAHNLSGGSVTCGGYGGGVYVVAGTSGTGASSSDAATWTTRTLNIGFTTPALYHYFANASMHIIGTSGGGSNITTSPDGATWTARASNIASTAIIQYAASSSSRVVIGGSGGKKVASSSNGTSFTERDTGFSSGAIAGLAYGNSTFVAFSSVGGISTSSDGDTWTLQTGATVPTTGSGGRLVFFNGYFWLFAAGGITSTTVFRSTDGATWGQIVPQVENLSALSLATAASGQWQLGSDGRVWTPSAGTMAPYYTVDGLAFHTFTEVSSALSAQARTLLIIANDIVIGNYTSDSTYLWASAYYGYNTSTQFKTPKIPPLNNSPGHAYYIRAL